MAGILNLHVLYALQNGWKAYKDDAAAFKALFRSVNDATLAAWHAYIVANPPDFRSVRGKGPPENLSPWVVVSLADEKAETRCLGDFGGRDPDTGAEALETVVSQDVRITIMARNNETVQALMVMFRAVLILAARDFVRAGYEDFAYEGLDQMNPDEEMLCVDLGIFMGVLRCSAKSIVSVSVPVPAGLEPGAFDWFVQMPDVEMDPSWPVVDGKLPDGTPIPAPGAGTPGSVIVVND